MIHKGTVKIIVDKEEEKVASSGSVKKVNYGSVNPTQLKIIPQLIKTMSQKVIKIHLLSASVVRQ